MIEGMILKGISQSVSDVDEGKGIVTGYFSSFDTLDSDGDIIVKGAYARTIKESGPAGKNRIKHLENHDMKRMVAKVLELKEDHFGLYFVSKAGSHTLGQDWLKMCIDGLYTEHSVGFKVVRSHKGEHLSDKANFITEINLWEGSSVTWGANEFTPIQSAKSLEDFVSLFYKLEKALRNGTYTDETFQEIEKQYNLLGVALKEAAPIQLEQTIQPGLNEGATDPEAVEQSEQVKAQKAEQERKLLNAFKLAVENGRGE